MRREDVMRAIRTDDDVSPSPLGTLTPSLVGRPDGAFLVRSAESLPAYPRRLGDCLRRWAREAPDRVFLAERSADRSWRKLTYAETLDTVTRIAAALLKFDLSPERPIVVLSGNDVEHALIGLAAMEIGVPYCPISAPYSLASQDFAKLKFAFNLLTPGLVYATDGAAFARAFDAVVAPGIRRVAARDADAVNGLAFADLLAARPGVELERARVDVGPDTIAKFLLTSGSLGAEGGDQHPAHDLRQSGDARPGVPVPRLGAAGAARLAAVEPHVRLQP
jgi:feruloyl-CoA synthase